MHPAYFETRFRTPLPVDDWPASFVIVSAYATTGESWSEEENVRADQRLEAEVATIGWHQRITGYSPATGHAEPSWAVVLPFDEACDLGHRFRQDAIYLVRSGELLVSHCDEGRRDAVRVGQFEERLDEADGPGQMAPRPGG